MLNRRWWLTPEMVTERMEREHERLRALHPLAPLATTIHAGHFDRRHRFRRDDIVTIPGTMCVDLDATIAAEIEFRHRVKSTEEAGVGGGDGK